MTRRPPGSHRPDPLLPFTTPFRSVVGAAGLLQLLLEFFELGLVPDFTLAEFRGVLVLLVRDRLVLLPPDRLQAALDLADRGRRGVPADAEDRKSTRLNSSH